MENVMDDDAERLRYNKSAIGCLFILIFFFVIAKLLGSYCDSLTEDKPSKSNHNNVYRSPYLILKSHTGVGSGFVAKYKDFAFVMTAAHVVEDGSGLFVYDSKNQFLGAIKPLHIDKDRDLAICVATYKVYKNNEKWNFMEFQDYSLEELEDIVGEDVFFHGLTNVGWWFTDRPFLPFTERTNLARVTRTKIKLNPEHSNAKECTILTVKGSGYYGCSGGPLLYKGKVIGVCSMLEQFPNQYPKAGTLYIYPFDTLKEFFESEDIINASKW